MSAQQVEGRNYLSVLDGIAFLLFAVAAVAAFIGAGSSILSPDHISISVFSFAAGWNHTAMIIGGVSGMAVSAVMAFVSGHIKKSIS